MEKGKELAVIVKAKDLGSYVFTVTDKSPKKFRFTLVTRLQNTCLDIIENLYYANSVYVKGKEDYAHIGKRNAYQKRAYVKVKMLLYFALIARENQCILPKQYEQISTQAYEVNRMITAWARSDLRRYKG
ncbi:MAG: four helix bundle protein [Anaerobutyricum hallii]|uniref:four helix bundle protein n=1 Tax=Anaerobutyricum hallii TaxID=39488 RepID=UPI002A813A87|nr:four helix bundle protein [Anaerobutyricum hallii]MDY4576505.1 four helix bundle protein [Anaerobutyricum hallii]